MEVENLVEVPDASGSVGQDESVRIPLATRQALVAASVSDNAHSESLGIRRVRERDIAEQTFRIVVTRREVAFGGHA